MKRFAPIVLVVTLAACGDGAREETPEERAPSPSPTASGTAAAVPSAAATASPAIAAAIPARFHGVWDAETGTCNPASDLRLEVGAREVGFYESHGAVTAVAEPGDGSADVTMAMEGEGEAWTTTLSLALVGAGPGERLTVRHEDGRPATPILRLKRCPA